MSPLWVLLRARRRELRINTSAAAAECGVSQGSYSKWEGGITKPGDEHLGAIAVFLGISWDEVVLARSASAVDPADRIAVLEARLASLEAEVTRLRLPEDPPAGPPGT